MCSTKILIFLIFLQIYGSQPVKDKSFTKGHRFRAVSCTESDKSVAYFSVCNLKAYSRKNVVLNMEIAFVKKFYKPVNIFIQSQYRYGNIYRNIYKVGPIEWCSIAETVTTNPLVKHFIESSPKVLELVKKCPLKDRVGFTNMTSEGGQFPLYPSGLYRDLVTISSVNVTLGLTIDYELKTDIKTSFK